MGFYFIFLQIFYFSFFHILPSSLALFPSSTSNTYHFQSQENHYACRSTTHHRCCNARIEHIHIQWRPVRQRRALCAVIDNRHFITVFSVNTLGDLFQSQVNTLFRHKYYKWFFFSSFLVIRI